MPQAPCRAHLDTGYLVFGTSCTLGLLSLYPKKNLSLKRLTYLVGALPGSIGQVLNVWLLAAQP